MRRAARGGCARVPGQAEARAPGQAEPRQPWGRRPAPRPRSGTGTTWTTASPATVSASPSACGSAPSPAGSPSTRCNGDWGRAAPGRGPGRQRGEMGRCPLPTRAWKPRGKGAEREDAGGSTIAGSRGTFCCRLKSDTSFRIPRTGDWAGSQQEEAEWCSGRGRGLEAASPGF